MIKKEITLCGKAVTLAYCYATEIAYKKLADDDMLDYAKHAIESIQSERNPDTERTLYAIIACMMAYYKDEEKVPVKDKDMLFEAMRAFMQLSREEREAMGKCGREYMNEFDKSMVVRRTMDAIFSPEVL